MKYEEIRAARLQRPFRPFKLRLKNGQEYLIEDPTTLAISPKNLAFVDLRTGLMEHTSPDAAESIAFVEHITSIHA